MEYGVIIENDAKIDVVCCQFGDETECVKWLRGYILHQLEDNMSWDAGKTHTHVDWFMTEDNGFDYAEVDFGDGLFTARILPVLDVPKKEDETEIDETLRRGYLKYILMCLNRGNTGDLSKVAGVIVGDVELQASGFQSTHLYNPQRWEPIMVACDCDGNEYLVYLHQLTRSQVEFIAREFFKFK